MALTERQQLVRLLAGQNKVIRQAFTAFLADARSPAIIRQARSLLEAGRLDQAVTLVDAHVLPLAAVLPQAFRQLGVRQVARLSRQLLSSTGDGARTAISFDVGNPRAADLMRANRLNFIRDFTSQQRQATRKALVAALQSGASPRAAAQAFRGSIGLTPVQLDAVDNYRQLLITGNTAALNRQLRDRRYDATVANAIEEAQPLRPAQIDTMVERYHGRLLTLRAETIARTESLRALSQAQQEAVRQITEQTGFEPDRVTQMWHSTLDQRTRDTHVAMNGQRRGLGQTFNSPSGAQLRYPGDPNAPASETINCRCVLTIEFT